MEKSGIIEPSLSEWAAPIVLVKKKDGTLRFCVDYRKLNSLSQANAYPMPRIDELIDQLGQAKYVTTLDLTRGYWQVPVAEKAREKTAFIYSDSWEEHLLHIKKVFDQLREAGLTAKPKKCQFAMKQYIDLRHVVGNGVIKPEQSKVEAVMSFPVPQTKRQVRAFLGVTGYSRNFIPSFATIAAPLTDLIRKNRPNRVELC